MKEQQGFTSILVSAEDLFKHSIPFAVLLDNNEVKAFVTYKDGWTKVEDNLINHSKGWGDSTNYKPLIVFSDGLLEQMEVWGWIMVGDL